MFSSSFYMESAQPEVSHFMGISQSIKKKLTQNLKIHFHRDRKKLKGSQPLSDLKTRELHNFMVVLLLNSM